MAIPRQAFLSASVVAGLLAASGSLPAAVPTLDHLHPVAFAAGSTGTVTAIGKFDPWPVQAWVDDPHLTITAQTNTGRLTVAVAPDAPAGPHLVRFYNGQGASAPRLLLVSREPTLAEAEPNDEFTRPQAVERFPVSVTGRLDKNNDVDSYAVAVGAGETLVASLQAFTLGSPVDAVLRVVDAQGGTVAWNHDAATLDPVVAWTAEAAGTYVVQVFGFVYPAQSEIRFTGNDKCVYRLRLERGHPPRHTLPLGVRRGTRATLPLAGWTQGGSPGTAEVDATVATPEVVSLPLATSGAPTELRVWLGDGPEGLEQEPNDTGAQATRLEVPGAVTGRIGSPGDEDRFRFEVRQGARTVLAVQSAELGFPLDAWLRVEDMAGKELARNDDSDGADPRLEWVAPTNGVFVAAVGSLLRRGDPGLVYRLSLQPGVPGVEATVAEHGFVLAAGTTNTVKVTLKRRHGLAEPVTVSALDLPEGVTAAPVEVSGKTSEASLSLVAASEAASFSGPLRMIAVVKGVVAPVEAVLNSSSVNNGVPGGFPSLLIGKTDQLWLTVQPKAAPVPASDKKKKG